MRVRSRGRHDGERNAAALVSRERRVVRLATGQTPGTGPAGPCAAAAGQWGKAAADLPDGWRQPALRAWQLKRVLAARGPGFYTLLV